MPLYINSFWVKIQEAIDYTNNTGNFALALILVGGAQDYIDPVLDGIRTPIFWLLVGLNINYYGKKPFINYHNKKG